MIDTEQATVEVARPPTDEDIYKICKTLAIRYNTPSQYEDLLGEGLVACYECRAAGKKKTAEYIGSARRAMHDYINIKSKAVSIPSTWASRTVGNQISRGNGMEGLEGVKGGTLFQLFMAMSNDVVEVDKAQVATRDHAETYEDLDYHKHVVSVAKTTLTETEWEILELRYYKDMAQDVVAEVMRTNQKWVSRHEKVALGKLKEAFL